MLRSDRIRLQHMLGSALEALGMAADRTRQDLDSNRMLVLALVKSIENIGEAANSVSMETRNRVAAIPWRAITNMRHRLVHGYFEINLDIFWATIQEDLQPLVTALRQVLEAPDDS